MDLDKLIFSIAYNMTGEYETARDVVQDVNMKFLENPISDTITDQRNYVIRTTINHCLNLKKKEQRLQYVGTWLPEPVATDRERTIHHSEFEERNLLCYELAFLMELLSPTERAVFVLRTAYDFSHKEIADAIDISPDNARQLLKRAKEKIKSPKHTITPKAISIDMAKKIVAHISQGSTNQLISLFNDDICVIGDGGGKAPAARKPIFGKEFIAHSYLKLFDDKEISPIISYAEILSQPAMVVHIDDKIVSVQIFSVSESKVSKIFSITNPDKIAHLKKTSLLSHS